MDWEDMNLEDDEPNLAIYALSVVAVLAVFFFLLLILFVFMTFPSLVTGIGMALFVIFFLAKVS
ncbi:hypothetical protein SAMN05421809_3700 [Natronorubrum daqingense]|uniref:Uncharacterized protein n=1 Tax=Natronorubrum daqingense TaxID=588898 RepID=A0A1N7G2R4_9EURY|nr:hypothetical protein BB347_18410 [Natronorubrum daqingense]SIS06858.1 hypothetical protein SAMN05421809_3700 [Natronorubrum daqingense]